MQQASLDRLSDDRQLQHRFPSHETFLHQLQLLKTLDDFFLVPPVTDQPAPADFLLPAEKCYRSQSILLLACDAFGHIDYSATIRWDHIGHSLASVWILAPGQLWAGSSTVCSAGSGSCS
jgi:hypothetical protein